MRNYKIIYLIVLLSAISVLSFRSEIVYQKGMLLAGLSLAAIGIIYGFAKLSSIAGSMVADRLEKKFGSFQVINLVFLGQTGGMVLLYFNSIWSVVMSLCIFYFAENIFRSIFRAWILENTPQRIKTISLSIFNMLSLGIFALLNPVTGFVLDKSFGFALLTLIILRLISIVIMYFSKRKIALSQN